MLLYLNLQGYYSTPLLLFLFISPADLTLDVEETVSAEVSLERLDSKLTAKAFFTLNTRSRQRTAMDIKAVALFETAHKKPR